MQIVEYISRTIEESKGNSIKEVNFKPESWNWQCNKK